MTDYYEDDELIIENDVLPWDSVDADPLADIREWKYREREKYPSYYYEGYQED